MVIEFDGEAWWQFEELLRRYAVCCYVVKLRLHGWLGCVDAHLRGVRNDQDETVLLYQMFNEEMAEGSGQVFEVNMDLVEYVYVY